MIRVPGAESIEKVPVADTGSGANKETEVNMIVIRNRDAMCRE
jgi:hypothetical protein